MSMRYKESEVVVLSKKWKRRRERRYRLALLEIKNNRKGKRHVDEIQ